jgi:antitoxin YobK
MVYLHRLSDMDFLEFDALAEPLRQKSAGSAAAYGFVLIEGQTATVDEVADVEQQLGVNLPEKDKAFMMRYGGGQFGFVDLFPIVTSSSGYGENPMSVNDRQFPERTFIAVAPVGTGDHWGFPVVDGRCRDEVWFTFHDAGDRYSMPRTSLSSSPATGSGRNQPPIRFRREEDGGVRKRRPGHYASVSASTAAARMRNCWK